MIPKIQSLNDQDSIERYLAELAEARNQEICDNDNLLIYGSLQRSGKFDIYTSLSNAEKTNIANFAKWIRQNYGSTPDEKRSEYASLQQHPGESPTEFLRRIEKSYFRIKGLIVPETLEDWQKSDIKWTFLSGLTDEGVKKHLLLKDSIYENLGIDARKIQKQLNGLDKKVYSVNSVTDDCETHEATDVSNAIASIHLRLSEIERLLSEKE